MLKFGIADYGMNVWFSANHDYEKRPEKLKAIGCNSIERLSPLDDDINITSAHSIERGFSR